MAYTKKYPLDITPDGDDVYTGTQKIDAEFGELYNILSNIGLVNLNSNRQSVLYGSRDLDGKFNYLTTSGLDVSITASVSVPLVVTFANGFNSNGTNDKIEAITNNVSAWVLSANQICYLYIDKDVNAGLLSYGYSLLPDLYQGSAPPSPMLDQHWFNEIDQKMYRWNGSAWEVKQRVFMAKAITGASISTLDIYSVKKETDSVEITSAESTGYGVISGCEILAQGTPAMTVKFGTVEDNIVHLQSTGKRFPIGSNSALAITTADATTPRIDLIYIDTSGVLRYAAGTPAISPVSPTVPSGCLDIYTVTVAAGATSITSTDITDLRVVKPNYQNMLFLSALDCGAKGDGVTDGTEAFIKLFKKAEKHNTDIIVPPLIYKLTGTIEFNFTKPRVVIMTGATILNYTTTVDPLLHIRSSCTLFAPKIINQPGTNPSPTSTWGEGTYLNSPLLISPLYGEDTATIGTAFSGVTVNNLEIEKSIPGASAVCVLGAVTGIELNNCTVDANATDSSDTLFAGFNVQSNGNSQRLSRVKINNCYVKNLAGEAIPYYLSGSRSLSAYNCGADSAKFGVIAHVGDDGTTAIGDAQLEFIGGEFTNISGYFVQVIGHKAADKSDKKLTSFTFERLRMIGKAGATSAVPLRVVSSPGGVRFRGNYMKDVNTGMYLTDCEGGDFSDNIFENILTSTFTYGGIGIALADKVNGNKFSNNKFISCDKEAMQFLSSSRNIVYNNKFYDVYRTGNTTIDHAAITLASNAQGNYIDKNIFGYSDQLVTPYKWISIKDATANLDKIIDNEFYACASGTSIYNYLSSSSYSLITLIKGNNSKSADALFVGANPLIDISGSLMTYLGSGSPLAGTHKVGDRVKIAIPTAGGYSYKECTTAGTPGTWKGTGLIEA
ncbi:hypothetical protein SPSIL_015220 [Sporomusa silvacetica DSM 10669]|uniref:Pectate lyase superfamily protein n=1 Tax=Sporomusa silvacetica DSM 10669 TaxID=1123289 RepID=A0ABZ3IIW1_9FIRM|nr:right-handed parallel beta-helix repeat-containing protein [Sporomusa silvacetica]OZC21584.1 hypothetical protein SPSIL_09950 [Sporomusa silvacetica DSM 10669]